MFPFFVGVCCWSLFCNAELSVLSSFTIISPENRELVALLWLYSCSHVAVSVVSLFIVEVCCWSLFCNAVLSVLSSFTLISLMRAGCLDLTVLLLTCGCWCSVPLPRCELVCGLWSVIVAFPGHTHLLYFSLP